MTLCHYENWYKTNTEFLAYNNPQPNDTANLEFQYRGVDTIFRYNGEKFICDEKAVVGSKYLNRKYKLGTFSLELTGKNDYQIGWFLDTNELNNSYMFIWVDRGKTQEITSPQDILEYEFCLVRKNDLSKYLDKHGLNYDKLVSLTSYIKTNNLSSYTYQSTYDGTVFPFVKCNTIEGSIILKLTREVYRELSVVHDVVKLD